MYRLKLLLGSMVAIFSVVYLIFGIAGWVQGDMRSVDLLTCFVLASVHLGAGAWLIIRSLKESKKENRRVEAVVRYLIRANGGRVTISDLARFAEINEDDAREYLERRSRRDVAIVMQNSTGADVFFFGQQFWNN